MSIAYGCCGRRCQKGEKKNANITAPHVSNYECKID